MLFVGILVCAIDAIQGCTPLSRAPRKKNPGSIPLSKSMLSYCLLCANWLCKFSDPLPSKNLTSPICDSLYIFMHHFIMC